MDAAEGAGPTCTASLWTVKFPVRKQPAGLSCPSNVEQSQKPHRKV